MIHITRKISLPGAQTSKTGARKGAANGVSQVLSHLVFSSPMSSLVALTLRNRWESINFPKVTAFWELIWCGVWHSLFYFIDSSVRAHGGQEFKAQCSEKLMTSPELCPGCAVQHSALPGWPGDLSCILATRASSVHSAKMPPGVTFCREILFWKCLSLCWLCKECEHHRVRWTESQLFSTKHKNSFSSCSALHLNISSLLPSGSLCFHTLFFFIKWPQAWEIVQWV